MHRDNETDREEKENRSSIARITYVAGLFDYVDHARESRPCPHPFLFLCLKNRRRSRSRARAKFRRFQRRDVSPIRGVRNSSRLVKLVKLDHLLWCAWSLSSSDVCKAPVMVCAYTPLPFSTIQTLHITVEKSLSDLLPEQCTARLVHSPFFFRSIFLLSEAARRSNHEHIRVQQSCAPFQSQENGTPLRLSLPQLCTHQPWSSAAVTVVVKRKQVRTRDGATGHRRPWIGEMTADQPWPVGEPHDMAPRRNGPAAASGDGASCHVPCSRPKTKPARDLPPPSDA
jgi:hypothetical protein